MNKTKIVLGSTLVLLLLFNYTFAKVPDKKGVKIEEQAKTEIIKSKDTSLPSETKEPDIQVQDKGTDFGTGNYLLVTDVIDAFGGQKYEGGCDLSIFAGGQSSAIGPAASTNFNLYAGFIYPTVVKCGDANGDGNVSVSDVVYLINYLFKGGPVPVPWEAGEVNCDGNVSVSDVVYMINYLFKGGAPLIC